MDAGSMIFFVVGLFKGLFHPSDEERVGEAVECK